MQYRADFFVALLNVLITLGTAARLQVIFGQTEDLRGWTQRPDRAGGHPPLRRRASGVVDPAVMRALMEGIRRGRSILY